MQIDQTTLRLTKAHTFFRPRNGKIENYILNFLNHFFDFNFTLYLENA